MLGPGVGRQVPRAFGGFHIGPREDVVLRASWGLPCGARPPASAAAPSLLSLAASLDRDLLLPLELNKMVSP